MVPILLGILVGVIAGILRSVLGFFKDSEIEDFEWKKLLKSVVIMGITGGVIGLFTVDWKLTFALAFTGGVAVEELISAYINKRL